MALNPIFNKEVILAFLKEFFKDPVKGMLLLCVVAISILFTYLYKGQESDKVLLKEEWSKCENENYIRDVKINYLLESKAKSDSLLNRVMGKIEAFDELKKRNNEISNSNRSASIIMQ